MNNMIPESDALFLEEEQPGLGRRIAKILFRTVILTVVIVLAAVMVMACVLYTKYVSSEDGEWVIDMTGEEVASEDIRWLSERLPDARIIYSVDLGGMQVENDVTALTLSDQQDVSVDRLIEAAAELPGIVSLNLTALSITPEQHDRLCAVYPEAEILWLVPVNGQRLGPETAELALSSMAELRGVLEIRAYLPKLRRIDMTGAVLTPGEQQELMECIAAHGDIDIPWSVTVAGKNYPWDTTSVRLTGVHITDLSELYRLPLLNELTLDGIGTGDLSPIVSISTLESLTVCNMNVDDVMVLTDMYWLGAFYVKNTNVTQAQLNRLQDELPQCIMMKFE